MGGKYSIIRDLYYTSSGIILFKGRFIPTDDEFWTTAMDWHGHDAEAETKSFFPCLFSHSIPILQNIHPCLLNSNALLLWPMARSKITDFNYVRWVYETQFFESDKGISA